MKYQSKNKQIIHDSEELKKFRKTFIQFHQEFFISTLIFTDHDYLQKFKTDVLKAIGIYKIFVEEEILNRKKNY